MRNLLRLLPVLVLSLLTAVSARGQSYLTVQASAIKDASGTNLTSGSISFQATNSQNVPIPFQACAGGQTVTRPVTASIVNGAITSPSPFLVANPACTSPTNIRYHIQVKQGTQLLGDYINANLCLQGTVCSSGYIFDFDTCISSGACANNPLPVPSIPAQGPAGPTGATGATGAPGPGIAAWSSGTTYSAGAVVSYMGLLYSSIAGSNLNHLPTDAMYWTAVVGNSTTGILWDVSHTYNSGDVVSYGGSLFVSVSGTNLAYNPAFQPTKWKKISPADYYDIANYGARVVGTGDLFSVTANCTATSTTITISGASIFQNGDGFTAYGCGATNASSTPSAPTVTPSVNRGPLNTGLVSNANAGGTTYQYKLVGIRQNGGYTVASSAGSTATGNSALGAQSATINGCTRADGTTSNLAGLVTCTTSASHNIPVLTWVHLTGQSPASFTGWYLSWTGTTGSTLVLNVGQVPSAGGEGGDTATTVGGTVTWFEGVHLTWTWNTDFLQYAIYKNISGTYTCYGVTRPKGTVTEAWFDDWGATISGNQSCPAWLPSTAPAAAKHDALTTTIVSGGGTTTLVVANAAINSATAVPATFDDAPALLAAANAATSGLGVVYIPSAAFGSYFTIASRVTMPTGTTIIQSGSMHMANTLVLGAAAKWLAFGNTGGLGAASGGLTPGALTSCGAIVPCIYQTLGYGSYVDGPYLLANGVSNGVVLLLSDDTAQGTWRNMTANTGYTGGNSDNLGAALVFRSTGSSFDNRVERFSFVGGPNQNIGQTDAPLILGIGPSGGGVGNTYFRDGGLNRRGVYIGGDGATATFDNMHLQGPITPFFVTESATGLYLDFIDVIMDSTPPPIFAGAGTSSYGAPVLIRNSSTGGSETYGVAPTITGWPLTNLTFYPVSANQLVGQNINLSYCVAQNLSVPVFSPFPAFSNSNSAKSQGGCSFHSPIDLPGQHRITMSYGFVPTSVTASAATAGGSVPLGHTYTYKVTANGYAGGQGTPSTVSNGIAPSGGNQTIPVAWTGTVGAKSYTVYRSSDGGTFCQVGIAVAAASFSDTVAGPDCPQIPSAPGAGATDIGADFGLFKYITLAGALSSGISHFVSIKPGTMTADFNYNIPLTAGSAGQAQISGGGGSTPMDWVTLPVAQSCGTTTTCAHTDISASLKIVKGNVALSSGTPSTATITGISPAFTSTATYDCTLNNYTSAAGNLLSITKVSGSSFTITGPITVTDTVGYICVGN